MLVKEVAAHFGSEYKAAKALKCNQSNLSRWGRKVPERWALKLHWITDGKLPYKPEEYGQK